MSDPLDDLKKALEFTPENHVLRAHIVRELLKARRWEDAAETALPLRQSSTHQALEDLVQARLAVINKQTDKARELYQKAIAADRSLIDEALEAQLEPSGLVTVTPCSTPSIGSPSVSSSVSSP